MNLGEEPEEVRFFREIVLQIVSGTDNNAVLAARKKYSAWRETPNSITTSLYVCENIQDESLKFLALEILNYHIRLNHQMPNIADFIIESLYSPTPRFREASRVAAIGVLSSQIVHDFSILEKIPFNHPDAPIFFEKIPRGFTGINISSHHDPDNIAKIKFEFLHLYFSLQVPDIYIMHYLISLREFFLAYEEPPMEITNGFIQLAQTIIDFPDVALAFKLLEDFGSWLSSTEAGDIYSPTEFTRSVLLYSTKFAEFLYRNEIFDRLLDLWNFVLMLPSTVIFDIEFQDLQIFLKLFFKSIPRLFEKGSFFQDILIRFCDKLETATLPPDETIGIAVKLLKVYMRYGVMMMQCHVPLLVTGIMEIMNHENFYQLIAEGICGKIKANPESIFKIISSLQLTDVPPEILVFCFELLQKQEFYQDYSSMAFHFMMKVAKESRYPNFTQFVTSNLPLLHQILALLNESFPGETFTTATMLLRNCSVYRTPDNLNFWCTKADEFLANAAEQPSQVFAQVYIYELYYSSVVFNPITEENEQSERIQALYSYIHQIDNLSYFYDVVHFIFTSPFFNDDISLDIKNIFVKYICVILTSEFNDFHVMLQNIELENHANVLGILIHVIPLIQFEDSMKIVQCIDSMLSVFTTSQSFKFLSTFAFSNSPINFDNAKMLEIGQFLTKYEDCSVYYRPNSEFLSILSYYKQLENFNEFNSVEEWLLESGLDFENQQDKFHNIVGHFHTLFKLIFIFKVLHISDYLASIDVASCDIYLLNEVIDFVCKATKYISPCLNWIPTSFIIQLFSYYNKERLNIILYLAQLVLFTRSYDISLFPDFVSSLIRSMFTYYPVDMFNYMWVLMFLFHQDERVSGQLMSEVFKCLTQEDASCEAVAYFELMMHAMQENNYAGFVQFMNTNPGVAIACDKFYLWRQMRA